MAEQTLWSWSWDVNPSSPKTASILIKSSVPFYHHLLLFQVLIFEQQEAGPEFSNSSGYCWYKIYDKIYDLWYSHHPSGWILASMARRVNLCLGLRSRSSWRAQPNWTAEKSLRTPLVGLARSPKSKVLGKAGHRKVSHWGTAGHWRKLFMGRYIPGAFHHTLLQNHLGKCGLLELLLILVAGCLWLPILQTLDTSEVVYTSGAWHLGNYLLGQGRLCRESLEHRKQISLKFSLAPSAEKG